MLHFRLLLIANISSGRLYLTIVTLNQCFPCINSILNLNLYIQLIPTQLFIDNEHESTRQRSEQEAQISDNNSQCNNGNGSTTG